MIRCKVGIDMLWDVGESWGEFFQWYVGDVYKIYWKGFLVSVLRFEEATDGIQVQRLCFRGYLQNVKLFFVKGRKRVS